jgi:hypothetical protein
MLIVKDVITEENHCEDGQRCIDVTCPLNCANMANFRKYNIHTKAELKKLHDTLEKWKFDMNLTISAEGGLIFHEKPLAAFKRTKK